MKAFDHYAFQKPSLFTYLTTHHLFGLVAIKHFSRQVTHFGFRGKSNPITKVHYSVWSLIEVVHTTSYHRMKIAWKPLVAQNRDAYLRSPPPKQLRASMMEFFPSFFLGNLDREMDLGKTRLLLQM